MCVAAVLATVQGEVGKVAVVNLVHLLVEKVIFSLDLYKLFYLVLSRFSMVDFDR